MKVKEILGEGDLAKRFNEKDFLARIKIEATVLKGLRHYFERNGYIEVVAPHITKATGACENIATMFDLDYFGRHVYLTQTGQLYLEVLSQYLGKTWCTIHSFRAEPRVDNRHLTEFVLVEMEFLGGFNQLLSEIERAIGSAIRQVLMDCGEEMELLDIDKERLKSYLPPFEKITYTEAVEELSSMGVRWGDDLKSIHEKTLVKLHGNKPLFITHYPKAIKFFNMKENEENPNIVNSADLLLPFSGEAVGAAEREHNYYRLVERLLASPMYRMLQERGGDIRDFDWYLDFWKNIGGKKHSGCGIGVARVVQSVLGANDIRLTTAFPMNRETLY
ncbi:MAG: hypothetical protein J7K23_00730 [Thermoproteales archaeon]|nr:hypothetical protein [Thermoproteales archaeon]